MLKLVICECAKLKRSRVFVVSFLTTFRMPCMYALILKDKSLDNMMSVIREENGLLLLVPLSVVLAANLFFTEHDEDTLKNLLCIPVTKSRLAAAKLVVLLGFDICYEMTGFLAGTAAAAFAGADMDGLGMQLFLTLGTGVLVWAAAMPCIVLVIWCNRSYIISVIVAFAYTVGGYILRVNDRIMMVPLGPNVQTFLPAPMIIRWLYQYHPTKGMGGESLAFYERFAPYFVSTPAVFFVLLAEAFLCAVLLTWIYKKQSV